MTSTQITVPALARALEKRGYETLTPVQSAILAPELRDADLMVSAQTRSGKTVAFGLALAPTLLGKSDRFEQARDPLALIIAPTRELAMQVTAEIRWLFAEAGGVVVLVDRRSVGSAHRDAHECEADQEEVACSWICSFYR